MNRIRLTTQLNLLFTIITLLTSFVFSFALNQAFREYRLNQNSIQLQEYFRIVNAYHSEGSDVLSDFNGYYVSRNGVPETQYNLDIVGQRYDFKKFTQPPILVAGSKSFEYSEGGRDNLLFFYGEYDATTKTLVVVFTNDAYINSIGRSFNLIVQISFIAMVLLGNVVILMWSRITVERVKKLKVEVDNIVKTNYQEPIEVYGTDEITELATSIEKMRQEIDKNEKTKQEMFQNISHDFKTPIAVIRSYAEAINDGVSEPEDALVIVQQAELLNDKVKQLLELSKLEYLKNQTEFEVVDIKELITNIVNYHKYRNNIEFITDLDDSTYFGIAENYYDAFSNIVDNALRYAKTKIVITLKNKKLTFFNDGEHISDDLMEHMFKPYQKGNQGQFGLGMSIVHKTLTYFNLTLTVKNIDGGVEFVIEPL